MEAVVAAFLMVFAFAASASLFDASLRWESQSANLRKAAFLAERKMEEIRAKASAVPSGANFAAHLDTIIGGTHAPYPGSPGFKFEVSTLPNTHLEVETSGYTPTPGVHSPSSTLFTAPDNPGSVDRSTPVYLFDNDPNVGPGDFQKNNFYDTYPYSRSMDRSYRLVQVRVNYGSGLDQHLDLVSLIGDPILPPEKPASNMNVTATVVRTSGPANLTSSGAAAEYEIRVTTANGSRVEDVSAIWSIYPLTSGTVDIFALNAAGTRVRVTRSPLTRNGTSVRLFPQIRYEGIEARALSGNIGL